MAPKGLRFDWRSLAGTRGDEAFAELAVVTFQGSCGAEGLPSQPFRAGSLGFTYVSQGTIIPFARVDCGRIRAFLANALLHIPAVLRERALGRAIGRVLAHELYHVFTRSVHHESKGVQRDSYNVEDLMADEVFLDRDEFQILKLHGAEDAGVSFDAPGSLQAGQSAYVQSGCAACHGPSREGSSHAPSLRVAGEPFTSVRLAAILGEAGRQMCQRAHDIKVPPPSLAEDDVRNLVRFLNSAGL